jgi:hypothetical protein
MPRYPQQLSKSEEEEIIQGRNSTTMPEEFQQRCLDILCKHQDALSIDRYDLGLSKYLKHKTHLIMQDPVYQKQF